MQLKLRTQLILWIDSEEKCQACVDFAGKVGWEGVG